MSQSNFISKKENPDKTAKDKNNTWINPINNWEKNSFFVRHFLCIFVFILLIIYLYISYKKDIRTYFFLSNLKVILPALIAGAGVFEGFNINRKKSFKEIVTKERINWLHKMQENLSEYLKLTNSIMKKDVEKIVNEKEKEKAKLLIEEKKDKINKLYYEIIFNINHENDIVAYNTIKKYNSLVLGELDKITLSLALTEDIKLELLALPGDEDELLLKIKDESESNKIKDLIKKEELKNILIAEDKDKNKNKDIDEKELPKEISLLRKEVSEEFTKIFNETWNRIKREAD